MCKFIFCAHMVEEHVLVLNQTTVVCAEGSWWHMVRNPQSSWEINTLLLSWRHVLVGARGPLCIWPPQETLCE